jgi:hypothetical protein
MATEHAASALLSRAEACWAEGDGAGAMALFDRAAVMAEGDLDADLRVEALLGLARGQPYNLHPGLLPVRLHAAYDGIASPRSRARLAAALARCWAYAGEPRRAAPFALEALSLGRTVGGADLEADALDAALASHGDPDALEQRRAWALRLGDVSAHLVDPEARLQAELWSLTVAWEVLDLPRMHRAMRVIEHLADESPRAAFFAASRRLALDLLRGRTESAAMLVDRATSAASRAVVPDAQPVVTGMRGYAAYFAGDRQTCAALAPVFEEFATEQGVPVVRAEAAVMWLGAGQLDKCAEMVGAFSAAVLADLPRDSDWLLTLQCVLEGALAVTDRGVVADVVGLLDPYAGRSVVNAGAVMWHGVTDDTLGRAHALLGHDETATRHLVAARATYERIGARWWCDRLADATPHSAVGRAPAPGDGRRTVHLHAQPGGTWLVGREGATFVLPRLRGLEHLHALLSRPDRDVPAWELAGGAVVARQAGLELLDDQARAAYRAHLARLDDELAAHGDEALRLERDAVAAQLAGATGLAGRSRRVGGDDERARVAVRKAVVAALARISDTDPWLARHLHDHVRTGSSCRYDTDPDHPVAWVLEASTHDTRR